MIFVVQCEWFLNQSVCGTVNVYLPSGVEWDAVCLSVCCRRGTSGSLSAKLQSGRPEDFPVSPQLHIYVMPSCSYRVSISIAWTELYGQVSMVSPFNSPRCPNNSRPQRFITYISITADFWKLLRDYLAKMITQIYQVYISSFAVYENNTNKLLK